MIVRLKSWFRFDPDALAATANALAAFSGVPVQLYDLQTGDPDPGALEPQEASFAVIDHHLDRQLDAG